MGLGLFVNPKQYFKDSTGAPLAGGFIYTYESGTSTPLATYSDINGTENANPIVLDSAGAATIYVNESIAYKVVIKDSSGNTLYTKDPITSFQELTSVEEAEEGVTDQYVLDDIMVYQTGEFTISPNGTGSLVITRYQPYLQFLRSDSALVFQNNTGFKLNPNGSDVNVNFRVTAGATNYIVIDLSDTDYIDIRPDGTDSNIDLVIQASSASTPMYFENAYNSTSTLFPTADGSASEYLKYSGSNLSFDT